MGSILNVHHFECFRSQLGTDNGRLEAVRCFADLSSGRI